jgi:protein ImuB
MPLSDARSICPGLGAVMSDAGADLSLLRRIAAWCDRFTPVVVVMPPDIILLEMAGSLHLFKDEAAFLVRLRDELERHGLRARTAGAPNPAAAGIIVRFAEISSLSQEDLPGILGDLPHGALNIPGDVVSLLLRLGLNSIGDLNALPRAALAARAGEETIRRLDEAMGRRPLALVQEKRPPAFWVVRRFMEPATSLDAIMQAVGQACMALCSHLSSAGMAAERVRLKLFRTDRGAWACDAGFSRPETSARIMEGVIGERLKAASESLNAPFGFELIRLEALGVSPFSARTAALIGDTREDTARLRNHLLDRLSARLGAGRVVCLTTADTHAPERASVTCAPDAAGERAPHPAPDDGVMRRPIRLFDPAQRIEAIADLPDGPPLRFRWRGILHSVVRAEGPERICADWLRAPAGRTRDYYRIENEEGRRYWIYREGAYGENPPPQWRIHGLFP